MILVTGGTGLVGSHLLYQLTISGKNPVAIKRSTSDINKTRKIFSYYSNEHETLFKKIRWIVADILDYDSILGALDGINYVYHTAATVSFQSSDKRNLINTNVQGTINIVNASLEKKITKLIHVSSIGALGRADASGLVTEDTHWNSKKSSVYSTSKYHSEMEVWRGMAEGLDAVIVNPSIILGPSDWNAGSSKLFTVMNNGLKFYSTGTNGFVDVVDVAIAMISLMDSNIKEERFILNSENISYKDLFFWMSEALGISPPKYKASRFLSEIGWRVLWLRGKITGNNSTITKETAETANQNYNYSNSKIKKSIDFKFIPIKESIKKNADFFKKDHNNL